MSNEGCHEPIEELSDVTRDMHRAITSLMEELEAVDWYNQRVDACRDKELKDFFVYRQGHRTPIIVYAEPIPSSSGCKV
ncbi:MAG: hypothetical protein OEW64_05810 [Gammaproteobacteria bacterium]|nr:hypothetical protein [Gammaproteobacteria bacterium]